MSTVATKKVLSLTLTPADHGLLAELAKQHNIAVGKAAAEIIVAHLHKTPTLWEKIKNMGAP